MRDVIVAGAVAYWRRRSPGPEARAARERPPLRGLGNVQSPVVRSADEGCRRCHSIDKVSATRTVELRAVSSSVHFLRTIGQHLAP